MDKKISRKVAVFVIREFNGKMQLLLINHPNTDYQFPAGTIKNNEDPKEAAIREVIEETGLEDDEIFRELEPQTIKYKKYGRLIKKAKIYSRPAKIASKFGKLRRGIKVKIFQEQGDFVQVRYRERDNNDPERPVMLNIIGWIKKSRLARVEKRYFYIVKTKDTQTQPWTVIADHQKFKLEWHDLEKIILQDSISFAGPQKRWLESYRDELVKLLQL